MFLDSQINCYHCYIDSLSEFSTHFHSLMAGGASAPYTLLYTTEWGVVEFHRSAVRWRAALKPLKELLVFLRF